MKIEDKGTYVIKKENIRFPEAEKYVALHKVGSPIVKLLDVFSRGNERFLVLEKAEPLHIDTKERVDFTRLASFREDFASANPSPFPGVDWAYLSEYWQATEKLLEFAKVPTSPLYDSRLVQCPHPRAVFQAYERVITNQATFLTHGDPSNLNLGIVQGKIVAFDLELTWLGDAFRDIALRTGASTLPYPKDLSVSELLRRLVQNRNLRRSNLSCDYRVVGAIYGAYFEQSAVAELQANGAKSLHYDWAKITIDRYIHFTLNLELVDGDMNCGFVTG